MKYPNIRKAVFLNRPNRFIAQVRVDNETVTVHVKNTGRCRELLVPGCTVWLTKSENPARKTVYDLVVSEKKRAPRPSLLINLDSQIPNDAAEEWLRSGGLFSKNAVIRREVTCGNSRFDFYVEDGPRRCYLEVKGVTLERDGIAYFPDAPTERGVKHVQELIRCREEGYDACILFVIQMTGVTEFRPHDAMHREFGDALREAQKNGVRILAMDCLVAPDMIRIRNQVPIRL